MGVTGSSHSALQIFSFVSSTVSFFNHNDDNEHIIRTFYDCVKRTVCLNRRCWQMLVSLHLSKPRNAATFPHLQIHATQCILSSLEQRNASMFDGHRLTRERLYVLFRNVTKSNHADGLPDAQTDTGGDTTVETLHTVLRVDVLESLADSHVLGTVGILLLALHLDTDDLDRLVPGGETTTKGGSEDLLGSTKLLTVLLASSLADTRLGDTGQTEAGAPVGDLAYGDGVDALVDTADTLSTVNVHECLHGAWGLDASRRHLVLCDLNSLHASAETHGSVGLGETTDHTTGDTRNEVVGAGVAGVELGLGCDEEEDGALGGSFDPSPGDETLVDCARILSAAATHESFDSDSQPKTPPRPQMRLTAPAMPSARLAAMVVFTTSRG
jgi:hypothetical protein